jgi:hypothetical protein
MNSTALGEAVISILTLPDRGQSIGQRGVEYCYQHLDVRADVERLVAIYSSLYQPRGNNS